MAESITGSCRPFCCDASSAPERTLPFAAAAHDSYQRQAGVCHLGPGTMAAAVRGAHVLSAKALVSMSVPVGPWPLALSPRSRRADQHRRGALLLVPERLQRWHRRALPRSRRQNSPASLPALPLGTRRHMTSARSPRRLRAWVEGGAADRQPVVSGRPGTQALGMTTWCGWTRCSEVR